MRESLLSIAWDRIVDSRDIGPPRDSTELLSIKLSSIAGRLIVDDKGRYLLNEDKNFTAHIQDLATASTVER